jgi:hypothetical protein
MTPAPRDRDALIVTDLDRTMIFSRNAIDNAVPDAQLLCVEYYQGAPLSFMTHTGAAALRGLAAESFVVPATTRTVEQFTRIDLPGAPWPYAITSNGGNILVDGVVDTQWRRTVADAMRDGGASLADITAALHTRTSPEWVEKFRLADDLFCYLVVRPDDVPADFLPAWGQWCGERGWTVSQQGRKIYMMPTAVCKSRAVAEVRSRLIADGALAASTRVLAAGDGGLDAEMLATADAGIRPRHGELELLQWRHPAVVVTASTGIVAGEEILRWFSAQRPDRPAAASR